MNVGMELFRMQNRFLSMIESQKAAKLAEQLFLTPRRHPLKTWEVEIEHSGTRIKLKNGISVIRWGTGIPVLLMHGWEARATQMAAFVEPLLQNGYQVLAIDAPAHGMSLGKQSHPMKFVEALFAAEREFGPFDAVIGHSMGAGSAIYAASQGLSTNKLVAIAGPASFQRASSRFATFIGLNGHAKSTFLQRVEKSVGLSFRDIDLVRQSQHVEVPVLVVHDEKDLEIPYSDAKELVSALPDARLFATRNLGHRKIMRDSVVVDTATSFVRDETSIFLSESI